MDIGLLRAFLTVAEQRNYGRAARLLLVTQPTLTKQIQSLEAQVGGRLFHRGRHGATPTELGAALVPEAQDLVRRADALAVRMARMAGGEIGRLSVGFGLSSIDLAPRLIAAFRRSHPDAYVTLEDMSSREQLDRLRAGELDVGFVRLPDEDGWGRLILGTDRLALASADHGDPPPPDPADISRWVDRHDFVQLVTARGPGLAGQINHFCTAVEVRPGIVQEAHDLQTVLALVAAGTDAAFVPASAARIAPPPITITPLRHPAAEWRIGAVWNPGHLPPLAASFLDLVRDGSAE